MSDELLVNVIEASRRLSIGRSLCCRLVQSGELPSIKINGARRILVSDLEEFIRRLRTEQEQDAS